MSAIEILFLLCTLVVQSLYTCVETYVYALQRHVNSRRRRSHKIIELKRRVEELEGRVSVSQAQLECLQTEINALGNFFGRHHDYRFFCNGSSDGSVRCFSLVDGLHVA